MPRAHIGFATSANYRQLTGGDLLAAEQLRKRGCDVVPLVWTEVDPGSVRHDAIVLRSVWDYHLEVDRFLAWVAAVAERTTVFNDVKTIRWNSDKRYLFDLQSAGLPVPGMLLLERGCTISLDALLRPRFSKAVVKPTVSASAFETHVVNLQNAQALEPRINALLRTRAMLVQDFVAEIETAGEWSLMFFGGEYCHAVRKIPQAGDFRVQAEFGGTHLCEEPGPSVRRLAQRVVDQFAANTLYTRVDVVEAEHQPLIMEVELIDPELFFPASPAAASRFADVILRMLQQSSSTRITTL